MNYFHNTQFQTSAAKAQQFPADTGHEVAFAGRSNAGKSSGINRLCNQNKLARKSKTPGRTQLINFFSLKNTSARLVDLPGYGYAKAPKSVSTQWHALIEHYFSTRTSLRGVVHLMDVRHPLTSLDTDFIHQCIYYKLPMIVLLSKADKLSRNQQKQTLFKVEKILQPHAHLIRVHLFSATQAQGVDALCDQLYAWLSLDELST